MAPADHRVTLLSRPGCHLCDDAREVIVRVCAELGVAWSEVDITASPRLWAAHHERIPVTFVDDEEHDYWRVSEERLRQRLLA
jgi:glutaredoxin